MIKNVASQKIGAQMVSASDGSAFSGTVTVYVCGDAGTQAEGFVSAGICTHEGNGYYTYAPAQGETNYDLIAFTFAGTGAIPATVQVFTRSASPSVTISQSDVTDALDTYGAVKYAGSDKMLELERLVVLSTTSGQPGVKVKGNGSANGMTVEAGDTLGHGIQAIGHGADAGIYAFGNGSSGIGILAEGGAGASGAAVWLEGVDGSPALKIQHQSTGDAVEITTTDGDGIKITAAGAGHLDINAANSELGVPTVQDMIDGGIVTEAGTGNIEKFAKNIAAQSLANRLICLSNASGVTMSYTGTISGNAYIEARASNITVGNGIVLSENGTSIGYIEAGNAYTEEAHGTLVAHGIFIKSYPGTGSITSGTLTVTITDTMGEHSFTLDLEDAENFYAWPAEDGSIIGYGYDGPGGQAIHQPIRVASGGSGGATAGEVADAVWDEAIADHLTTGTTGKKLSDAGAAGDPWGTAIPGSYTSGTAGFVLGTSIARESTVLGQFSVTQGIIAAPSVSDNSTLTVYEESCQVITFNLGTAWNLTGKEVWFVYKYKPGDTTALLSVEATVTDAVNGVATYTPTTASFPNAGKFSYEVYVCTDDAEHSSPQTVFLGTLVIKKVVRSTS